MYLLARRLFAGVGTAAYAEHFVLRPIIAGRLVISSPARERRWRFSFAGDLFGLALLLKQSAAAFVAGAAVLLILPEHPTAYLVGADGSAERLSSSLVPPFRRRRSAWR